MQSSIARYLVLAAFLAVTLAWSMPSHAHEGHDHGAPATPVSATIAPRADASSSDFELVAVARGEELTVYLDTFKGNRPVGRATMEIDAPGGILQPQEIGRGVYATRAAFLNKPGSYDLAFTINADGLVDVLTATLRIPDTTVAAARPSGLFTFGVGPAVAEEIRQRLPGAELPAALWIIVGFLAGAVAMFVVGRWRRTTLMLLLLALPMVAPPPAHAYETAPNVAARDISQRFADGALFVPKSTQRILDIATTFTEVKSYRRALELPGRVIADPNGSGLVQASVGGRLVPPPGGFKPLGTPVKTGDVLAYVHPPLGAADATSQQLQGRELEQQISIVARRVERLRAIERVIARSQLEDAELELKGLNSRRANLERANREPEPLIAPVDGVIAAANAIAGQMAEPNAVIFQIVNPTRLWVEALSFEPQTTNGAAQGLFADGRKLALAFAGAGLADRNQSIPIHFAITSPTNGLRAGQLLTVLAETLDERAGIALPREAILRGSNGQALVFQHTNAERFVPREVRIEQLDAERVLVLAGVEPGKRIVTNGAELLNQIR